MKLKMFTHIAPAFIAVAFLCSCSNDDVVQNGENASNAVIITFEGENQTPASRAANVATRTTATHAIGAGGSVLWESTDHIWVKDDGGIFRESNNPNFIDPSNQAYAAFGINTGSFTSATHQVVYTGKGSTSATEVEIKASQTQTATNSFAHLGESGDCGIATVNKIENGYTKFTLEHKAAYLAIYPRIQKYDLLHKNVKITKIVITSTSGPIAGKYAFSASTGLGTNPTPVSAASNTITLNTTSGEISSTTSRDTCYYAVIAPGTHRLKADYYIEDPTTTASTVISKDLGSLPCTAGKFTDISAWINKDLTDYPGNDYYMWDAKNPYWYGHEWNKAGYVAGTDQPFVNGQTGAAFPQNTDPNRWYKEGLGTFEGSVNPLFSPTSTSHVPNANEMSWYCLKGDPHWDGNKAWTTMGHLYKGGMWFLKKTYIIDFSNKLKAGSNLDLRKVYEYTNKTPSQEAISASELSKYFFLPAFGDYRNGKLGSVGSNGGYWASSTNPKKDFISYRLYFTSTDVNVSGSERYLGFKAIPFQ